MNFNLGSKLQQNQGLNLGLGNNQMQQNNSLTGSKNQF